MQLVLASQIGIQSWSASSAVQCQIWSPTTSLAFNQCLAQRVWSSQWRADIPHRLELKPSSMKPIQHLLVAAHKPRLLLHFQPLQAEAALMLMEFITPSQLALVWQQQKPKLSVPVHPVLANSAKWHSASRRQLWLQRHAPSRLNTQWNLLKTSRPSMVSMQNLSLLTSCLLKSSLKSIAKLSVRSTLKLSSVHSNPIWLVPVPLTFSPTQMVVGTLNASRVCWSRSSAKPMWSPKKHVVARVTSSSARAMLQLPSLLLAYLITLQLSAQTSKLMTLATPSLVFSMVVPRFILIHMLPMTTSTLVTVEQTHTTQVSSMLHTFHSQWYARSTQETSNHVSDSKPVTAWSLTHSLKQLQ